jgi:hypothetical protein
MATHWGNALGRAIYADGLIWVLRPMSGVQNVEVKRCQANNT